jgi:ribosomal protein S18 acetylase RimI-like enzyme
VVRIERVTRVTPELVQAVARLLPQLSTRAQPPAADALQAIVDDPRTHFLLARQDDGQIIGTLTLATYRTIIGAHAWIEDVIVDDAARGQGLGEQLTRYALELAHSLGMPTVDLTSNPAREAANRLYQRVGFERRETNVYRYSLDD